MPLQVPANRRCRVKLEGDALLPRPESANYSTANERLRFMLCMVDGPQCVYCGCDLIWDKTTIDHVRPRGRGGRGTLNNVVLACQTCNRAKGDGLPLPWMQKAFDKIRCRSKQAVEELRGRLTTDGAHGR